MEIELENGRRPQTPVLEKSRYASPSGNGGEEPENEPAAAVELPRSPDAVPMGGGIVADKSGATFRCWAPGATEVHIVGDFNDWRIEAASELRRHGSSWLGYVGGAKAGQKYKFHVAGPDGAGHKRDPYARELTRNWPVSDCILRAPDAYPWRVRDFRPPAFNDLIIYQLHTGVFNGPDRGTRTAKFLDVLGKLDHLVRTGVNAIQLLPVVEFNSPRSMGYNGADIFSPEMDYTVPPEELDPYVALVNSLLGARGLPDLGKEDLSPQSHQLKALVDVCHAWGVAVFLDVVYNHAGGEVKDNAESLWFFDRAKGNNPNDSLYFTDQDHTGPVWAIWKQEVRQFLIDNAAFFVREFQVDGFRYDQTSVIVQQNANDGWRFCQDLTSTVRFVDPSVIHIAEYWSLDPSVVRSREEGGAGFDACWHDGLRRSIREAVAAAAHGRESLVDVERIAGSLWAPGFREAWRAVQCIENHDEVYGDRGQRIPKLADAGNPRSWFATSRARVATGLLLTAPGIPLLFMGQELLEDKQWHDDASADQLVWWDGLDYGLSPEAGDFHRFVQGMTALRHAQPALRGERLRVLHARNDQRVLAFHRWLEGEGRDVVVVASFNEANLSGYELAFPGAGRWREIFNSGFHWGGNGGGIDAWDAPRDGMPATARIVIPANSIVVFAR